MKQYIYRSSRVLSAVAFVILVLTGCGRHNNKITTVNPIITGAAHTLPIAAANNAVVTDATNGLVFVFPSGGIGTMTVAPITDAPARSLPGGQGYQTLIRTRQSAFAILCLQAVNNWFITLPMLSGVTTVLTDLIKSGWHCQYAIRGTGIFTSIYHERRKLLYARVLLTRW